MELIFPQPVESEALQELRNSGVDPLAEPFVVSSTLMKDVATAAGDRLIGMLHRFVLGADSYLILRKAFEPTDLGETPKTFLSAGDTNWYHGAYTALTLIAIAKLSPISFHCENQGKLIINITVIPEPGRKGDKSRKELRGHTDACSFPFAHEFDAEEGISPSPDFVVLIGQRNPESVPTCVAPLSKIMKELPEQAIEELTKDQFTIGSQGLFDIDYARTDASVITLHPKYGYQVRFSHSHVTVDPALQKASKAISEMEHATQNCLEDVVVNPGDILFVNNRTALHGRRTVCDNTGTGGGKTRWIQRLYANLPDTVGVPVDPAIPFCLAPVTGWKA